MAGMELPLLSPATPDVQPAPVVKPQNQGFQHIAEAGSKLQDSAYILWKLGRAAQEDHDQAWTNAYTGTLQGVTDGVHADIHAGKIGPDTAAAETTKRLNDIAQPYIAQSTGEFKEKLQGILIAHSKVASEQAVIHATAENIKRQDANYKRSVDDLTNRIPLTPKDGQPPLLTQLHGSIDDYGQRHSLPAATVQNMHDDANAKIWWGHLQLMGSEAPGHLLMTTADPKFLQANADNIGRVGGIPALERLRSQALTQANQQEQAGKELFKADQQKDMDLINSYKMNGQSVPGNIVQQIHDRGTVGAAVLKWANPTYPIQPLSDPGKAHDFIYNRIPEIRDTSDAQLLQGEVASSPTMNAKERQDINAHIKAHLTDMNTAWGQAKSAALERIEQTLNPPPKAGTFTESYVSQGNAKRAAAARRAFLDATDGMPKGNPESIGAAADRAIGAQMPQNPTPPAARTHTTSGPMATPGAMPTAVMMKTGESPMDYAREIKAHGG